MNCIELSEHTIDEIMLKIRGVNRRKFIIFDWDNTCACNDTTEVIFYQFIEKWLFKMNATEFKEVVFTGVNRVYKVSHESSVSFNVLGLELYELFKEIEKSLMNSADQIERLIQEFKVKIIYMYQQLNERLGAEVGYVWVCMFFAGYTREELYEISRELIELEIKIPIREVIYTYSHRENEEAVVDYVSVYRGFQVKRSIVKLFKELKKNQVGIYICSASFEPLVEGVVLATTMAEVVNIENIYGMRCENDEKGCYLPLYKEGYPRTLSGGKVEAIDRYIISEYGCQPVMTAGDSNGDYEMLTNYENCVIRLMFGKTIAELLSDYDVMYVQ